MSSVCMCPRVYLHVCVSIGACVCVEIKGQPQVLFLKSHQRYVLRPHSHISLDLELTE